MFHLTNEETKESRKERKNGRIFYPETRHSRKRPDLISNSVSVASLCSDGFSSIRAILLAFPIYFLSLKKYLDPTSIFLKFKEITSKQKHFEMKLS